MLEGLDWGLGKKLKQWSPEKEKTSLKHRIALSRHDQHHLELKTTLDFTHPDQIQELDVFIVAPNTLHLRQRSKENLLQDFNFRSRLTLPFRKVHKQVRSHDPIYRDLDSSIVEVFMLLGDEDRNSEFLRKEVCKLGGLWSEVIKRKADLHSRQLERFFHFKKVSKFKKRIKLFSIDSKTLLSFHARLWEVIHSLEKVKPDMAFELAEYCNYITSQYVSGIRSRYKNLSKLHKNNNDFVNNKIEEYIEKLIKQEGIELSRSKLDLKFDDEKVREEYLLRIGKLKKYFQQQLFIDSQTNDTIHRLREPVAMLGAIFAACIAALLTHWSSTTMGSIGSSGLYVFALGIIGYTFRDRLKDISRNKLSNIISKRLPDQHQDLVIEKTKLGSIKNWVSAKRLDQSCDRLRDIRTQVELTRLTPEENEDCLHFHRQYHFNKLNNISDLNSRALHDILRINLAHLLEPMDDKYKEIPKIMSSGDLKPIRTRKIYQVLVFLQHYQIQIKDRKPKSFKVYRVTLDKTGIDKVEDVLVINNISRN